MTERIINIENCLIQDIETKYNRNQQISIDEIVEILNSGVGSVLKRNGCQGISNIIEPLKVETVFLYIPLTIQNRIEALFIPDHERHLIDRVMTYDNILAIIHKTQEKLNEVNISLYNGYENIHICNLPSLSENNIHLLISEYSIDKIEDDSKYKNIFAVNNQPINRVMRFGGDFTNNKLTQGVLYIEVVEEGEHLIKLRFENTNFNNSDNIQVKSYLNGSDEPRISIRSLPCTISTPTGEKLIFSEYFAGIEHEHEIDEDKTTYNNNLTDGNGYTSAEEPELDLENFSLSTKSLILSLYVVSVDGKNLITKKYNREDITLIAKVDYDFTRSSMSVSNLANPDIKFLVYGKQVLRLGSSDKAIGYYNGNIIPKLNFIDSNIIIDKDKISIENRR